MFGLSILSFGQFVQGHVDGTALISGRFLS